MSSAPSFIDREPDVILRQLLEETAGETGVAFFRSLTRSLAGVLGTCAAWVTEYDPERDHMTALAFWLDGDFLPHFESPVSGTPCEAVLRGDRVVVFPDHLIDLYPRERDVRDIRALSYIGEPLRDPQGRAMGHLAAMDRQPLPDDPRLMTVFRIFAARAAAELRRYRAERQAEARAQQLARLVTGAADAIVELDEDLAVVQLNPASLALLPGLTPGQPFAPRLDQAGREALLAAIGALDAAPGERAARVIADELSIGRSDGERVPVEASIARLDHDGRSFYALILRQRQGSGRVTLCTALVDGVAPAHELLGESAPMRALRADIARIAPTDATVLVQGESGTGKELVARALHAQSRRAAGPLVCVNCAALPATLVESELFGHVAGAFTGASADREGRFAQADGGTLFLDEIGELPLELQAKLLRALQEGEIEPLGSGRPRRVDVRVIAATNRDLAAEAAAGRFRQDLFYRLAVLPLGLPPLRERLDDLPQLAAHFAARCAQRLNLPQAPLTEACLARLRAHRWPGNVRELQHTIERAVILGDARCLALDRALPAAAVELAPADALPAEVILTAEQLRALERTNLLRALEAADWRVAGAGGAAERLGLPPSTVASRIKALDIRRP